jgi:hypothetical protein
MQALRRRGRGQVPPSFLLSQVPLYPGMQGGPLKQQMSKMDQQSQQQR